MRTTHQSRFRVFALTAQLTLALVGSAAAQVTTGTLAGSVRDQTGRPLAKAEVRVNDDRRQTIRTSVTDDGGFYRFVDLPPASYGVSASATGFRQVTHTDVPVLVDSIARIDFQLPLAT